MKRLVLFSCIAMIAAFLLPGCGTTTGEPSSSKMLASQECIGCHSTSTSHVTGLSIVSEWTASAHNTGDGASCADCHEPAAGHPNNCSRCHGGGAPTGTADHDVRLNPDADGTCTRKCHGLSFRNDVMMKNAPQHFGNMTATTDRSKRPSYVSTMYIGACRKCHNPHNPTGHMKQSRDWAASAHANVASSARSTDFKTRGTYEPANLTFQNNFCVRCHTSTGYINFVTSGFMSLKPFGNPIVQNGLPGAPSVVSPDDTKELTNCDVCHDDGQGNAYSFKLRPVPPVTIYYNISTSRLPTLIKINNADSRVDYPDVGPSNICIPCHSGRNGIAPEIKIAAVKHLNFSSASNVASVHALPPAQVLFKTGGYEFDGQNYSDPPTTISHRRIGIGNVLGTGGNGPCISCHANTARPHLFMAVTFDTDTTRNITSIASRTCSTCHNGSGVSGTILPPLTLTGSDIRANLQARKYGFHAALLMLNGMLTLKKVSGTTNWERLYGHGTGPNTMGASANYSLLRTDQGSYIHNDLYTRRLLYDSIVWLYYGNLTGNIETAINDPLLTFAAGTKDPVMTSVIVVNSATKAADIANLKAAAINYLIGGPGGQRP